VLIFPLARRDFSRVRAFFVPGKSRWAIYSVFGLHMQVRWC
jgi:hypothetical protein